VKHGSREEYSEAANIPGETSGSCSFATRSRITFPAENLLLAGLRGCLAFQTVRNLSEVRSVSPQPGPYSTQRQRDGLTIRWLMGRPNGQTFGADHQRKRYELRSIFRMAPPMRRESAIKTSLSAALRSAVVSLSKLRTCRISPGRNARPRSVRHNAWAR